MEVETGEGQVQIHLITKQPRYSVPETPYSIGANVGTDELNTLVNTLLKENVEHNDVEFDFLVFGEFLRARLGDHLKDKTISFEDVIEIEYVERYPAPEPKDCLLHDDWVSALKTCGHWILTGCYDNTLNIWTTKGSHVLTIPGHNSPIKAVSWISCDDKNATFVSCSQDQTAMLWEWNVGNNSVDCVYVCKGHERGVDSVDVSPDKNRFATGSWDTMLKIWSTDINESKADPSYKKSRPENGRSRAPMLTLQGHRECISSVQWMDQSTILTGSWDHTLKIWDLNLEGMKSEITGNKSFFDASYSKLNGLVITAAAEKNLRLYDPRSNQGAIVKNTYLGHSQWVQSVVWSTDEEYLFLSGSYDNRVKLWDYRSPNAPLYDLLGHEDKVLDVDWSNPKFLVSGGADNTVRIFRSKKAMEKISN